jgi:hypothetical protein
VPRSGSREGTVARFHGRADGTPAEPPSISTTVTNWRPGDTIPLGAKKSLRVVRLRDDDADQPPVLVVEDLP